MKKDTKTFLSAVLGIPIFLSGAWGANTLTTAGDVVYEREHTVAIAPPAPVPVVTPKKAAPAATTTVPAKKPVPVKKPVTQPVVVPTPVVAPVVTIVTPPTPVVQQPEPVVVQKSRRTRAS